ncbi:hypothetical protein MUN81_09820 [Hymenobacter sp. 5317J-9]|uniref:hypothetical protein n=1 Tax=Hymenobacter sp. 5317J-9 TaxID=2932250 RepID=UPI001FD6EA35|nr:hypothetical protein [Hymenobacter sp. 5317J-9]UOQ99777.1 hypothetical protein MUN81_09820 [Hymenobacter sp. 5317J-9]
MKSFSFLRLCLALLPLAVSPLVRAQGPGALPQNGYWNLETNLTTRDYTLVRFYNAQNQLVYQERLDGLCLNLGSARPLCRRTKSQLNATLEQVLLDPSLAIRPNLLSTQFGTDRRLQRVYAVRWAFFY